MHTPSRVSLMTRAALVAAALQLGGGQQRVDVRERPELNLADELVKRATQSRFARMVLGSIPSGHGSRFYQNGGQRRKRAIRARRMNNAGHGNTWSKRHA